LKVGEFAKEAAQRWKECSDKEKYEKEARKLKEKYDKEMKEYKEKKAKEQK